MSTTNGIELERRTRELHVLSEVAKTLTAPYGLLELLRAALDQLAAVFEPAEIGTVMLRDEASGLLRSAAAFGYDFTYLREMSLQIGESITGKVYESGVAYALTEPAEVAQMMNDMRPANRALLICSLGTEKLPHSALAMPLRVGERKFGVLVLMTVHRPAQFAQQDLPFVQTVADLIALAIDRARLEEQSQMMHEAAEADRLRSEVMATLSHELRTPLASIKGYSTALLLDEVEWDETRRREFLELIDEECDKLEGIIRDFLDAARIDAGRLEIEWQPVMLPRLAQAEVEDVARRMTDHNFVLDFPPDFPIVDADPKRIGQVLRNLLDNAVKYSPQSGLIVVRGVARDDEVVVSVADQGVGIAPPDLNRLFDRFFRVKAPTGYHVAGSGLGLPISQSIVEAHGGRIWAESQLGHGSTLYFTLPRTDPDAELDKE